jgi:hypothetical protein
VQSPANKRKIKARRPPGFWRFRSTEMAKKFPLNPPHPERNCWGCDKYCPISSLACGNGSERTQHPVELFGEGWEHQGLDPLVPESGQADGAAAANP